MIGTTEIIVIAVVILVLFGSAAIPKFARSLGKAKSEFERGVAEGKREADAEQTKTTEPAKPGSEDKRA